jgi:Cytochrome P460
MSIVAHVASLVSLMALAAVVLVLRSSAGDGRSDLRMSRAEGQQETVVDAQGNLHVPSNYRADYEFLGTWAIAADKRVGSSELHTVYANPGTIAAYHTSGHFPDGTVLIKEVYETSPAPMTTGTLSHAQTLKGWFVMVKDSRNSHPGNVLWGDG